MKRIVQRFINPTILIISVLSFLVSITSAGANSLFLPVVSKDKGFCPQVICNGDFEKGADGSWLPASSNSLGDLVIVNLSDFGTTNHSGNFAAWLGGDPGEVTSIVQQIALPGNAAQLSFWYRIDSNDTPGKSTGTVFLDTTLLKTYDLSQSTITDDWVNEKIAIPAELRGKTVSLIFKAEIAPDPNPDPAGGLVSSFLVDDVSIPGPLASDSVENPGQTPKTGVPFPSGLRKSPIPF